MELFLKIGRKRTTTCAEMIGANLEKMDILVKRWSTE